MTSRLWPWAVLLVLAPLSFAGAQTAPYLSAVLAFALCALPHNFVELGFLCWGKGSMGGGLVRAPRWTWVLVGIMIVPGFLYLIPGALNPDQKEALFHSQMLAVPVWIGIMAAVRCWARPLWMVPVLCAAAAAGWAAWTRPDVAAVTFVQLHNITALIMAALVLRGRPREEQRQAWPLLAGVALASIIGTWGLLTWAPVWGGVEVPAATARVLGASVAPAGASSFLMDRLMAVFSFQLWLHYGVWVMLVPALGLAPLPALPRPALGAVTVAMVIGVAAVAVVAGTLSFFQDFVHTRTIYLALAGLHVYGEYPALIFGYRSAT